MLFIYHHCLPRALPSWPTKPLPHKTASTPSSPQPLQPLLYFLSVEFDDVRDLILVEIHSICPPSQFSLLPWMNTLVAEYTNYPLIACQLLSQLSPQAGDIVCVLVTYSSVCHGSRKCTVHSQEKWKALSALYVSFPWPFIIHRNCCGVTSQSC